MCMNVQIKNSTKDAFGGAVGDIRFLGEIKQVKMAGIEQDGSLHGEVYFACATESGTFVPIGHVAKFRRVR